MESIRHLLQHVSETTDKYNNIAKITGERFNLFKLLRLETNEVRTHSAILGELLNPLGSHGFSDVFLKLFVSQFNIKDFETKTANVSIEKYIGFISTDNTEGGRIDILITQKNGSEILIENKIHALDQKNQLIRYKNQYPKAYIFYLTLSGAEASIHSTDSTVTYQPISYQYDIIKWLECCQTEASNLPILRETINLYINLLKSLTGQTINVKMDNEIRDLLLSSSSNFESGGSIASSHAQAVKYLIELFWEEVKSQTEKVKLNLFWAQYSINFIITEDSAGIFIGIKATLKNGEEIPNNTSHFDKLREIWKDIAKESKCSKNYVSWIYPNDYQNFYDILFKINDSEFRKIYVEELISECKNYFESFSNLIQQETKKQVED